MSGSISSHNCQSGFRKKKPSKKQTQEVCLLGVNQTVGDVEVLLDLPTFVQTSITTQRSEVLVLEMRHFERLLTKRNPKTIDVMRQDLEWKLISRMSKYLLRHVPLFRFIISKAEEYNRIKAEKMEARHNNKEEKIKAPPAGVNFDSFIPPRGPVIDLYGPGTVFHRIRQKENERLLRESRRRTTASNSITGNQVQSNIIINSPSPTTSQPQHFVDRYTSDPVLSNLENRIGAWMKNENSSVKGNMRVIRLQRSQAQVA